MSVNLSIIKKPHRKSRLGCKICKARRIKCDERRPVCGNCVRRFPDPEGKCVFEFTPKLLPVSRSMGRPTTNGSLASRPSHSSDLTSRALELRLFHHYATITARTLPFREETFGINMWTKSIPSIAFNFQHVYSAVLGLAAMHLLTLTPTDISLRTAVYQYLGKTISSQRKEIASMTPTNSLSIFTTSMLLTTHTKARAIWLANSNESYTPPLNWFYLYAVVRKIALETLSKIEDSNITAYAVMEPEFDSISSPIPDPLPNFPEDPFLHLWDVPALPPERREIYSKALEYLELIKSRIIAGEKSHWIQRRLGKVPGEVPHGFLGLLKKEDPLTLAILARFFALMKYVEEPWWLKGTAEFEIKGLAGLVGKNWEWTMKWPLEILEGVRGVVEEPGQTEIP